MHTVFKKYFEILRLFFTELFKLSIRLLFLLSTLFNKRNRIMIFPTFRLLEV